MNPFTQIAFAICASFSAYMVWAAFRVKKAVKRQSPSGRAVHLVMLFSSFFMCFAPFPHWLMLDSRIIPSTPLWGGLGVGVCAAGFAFCFWARWTLGANWSGAVTLKEGHELIQKGPYALSRHPMYTGILTGLLGVALTAGQVGNFLGVALLAFAMIRKMGMEESYLRSHFGTDYEDYSQKVKRLIPLLY